MPLSARYTYDPITQFTCDLRKDVRMGECSCASSKNTDIYMKNTDFQKSVNSALTNVEKEIYTSNLEECVANASSLNYQFVSISTTELIQTSPSVLNVGQPCAEYCGTTDALDTYNRYYSNGRCNNFCGTEGACCRQNCKHQFLVLHGDPTIKQTADMEV